MRDEDGEGLERLVLERKVLENHKQYVERVKLYQSYGFDIDKERKFVFEKAEPVFGDILEVGTGKGHFTLVLAKEGYRFTSVDISREEQKIAELNLKYFELENFVDFRIEDAEHLSFKDNSFDIIFSVNTVHHLKNQFKVMDELIRIVTFEGKIILSDFSKEGFKMLDKIHSSEGRIHERSRVNLQDIDAYLRQKGFKTEQYSSRFQEILIAYKPVL
ncbi:MAG: class I SAM-dependent methyltransferase [Candidatus Omnitrophica bacterium]|nr:class I SAM-dependent methyltransferase [Candidatus Omnitrophota bacterium]